jgi:hypothetical protein
MTAPTRSAEPPIRGLVRVDPIRLFGDGAFEPEWSFDPHGTNSACRLEVTGRGEFALHSPYDARLVQAVKAAGCQWDGGRKVWTWDPQRGDRALLKQVLRGWAFRATDTTVRALVAALEEGRRR